MAKFTHLIICLTLQITFAAGQNTFMKAIDMDNGSDSGYQIIAMQDGYLIMVGSVCTNNTVNCFGFLSTDTVFETVYYKKQYNISPYQINLGGVQACGIASERYYFAGGIATENEEIQTYFMEFDPTTGDSLFSIIRGSQYRDFTRSIIASSDSTLALLNYKTISPGQDIISLEGIDLEGTVLWESIFGQAYSYINPQSLTQLSNGDLLFTYSTCSAPNPTAFCNAQGYDLTMTRTDAEGQEVWTRSYPVSAWNVSNQVLAVEDGGFVASWARDFWFELDSLIAFPPSVLWFDAQGELVNSYYFPANDHQRTLINLYRAANGDIIGMGSANLGDEGLGVVGWVFRLSPQGALLWERYIADLNRPQKRSWLTSTVESVDGSLVFVGTILDTYTDQTPVVNDYNVWVVKLDSEGCLEPDCGTYQVITSASAEVAPTSRPVLRIYPNPARGAFQIGMEGFRQPLYPAAITLRGMDGRLVQQVEQSGNADINIAGLPAGVYVMQVRTAAGQTSMAKVVVQ